MDVPYKGDFLEFSQKSGDILEFFKRHGHPVVVCNL